MYEIVFVVCRGWLFYFGVMWVLVGDEKRKKKYKVCLEGEIMIFCEIC